MTPQQFKEARRRLGLTQTKLSKLLGIDLRTVQRYEAGDWPIPKAIELAMLALKMLNERGKDD